MNAWLVGAVLSPTDPVFAAAIVGREGVSRRLRHLLNVESGLNDGLALPIVLALLAVAGAGENALGKHLLELAWGCVIGVAIPWLALMIERLPVVGIARSHKPFFPFAVGLTVFASADLLHGNVFLAAFCAGGTLATMRPDKSKRYGAFGEHVAELLKLLALLLFGALITPAFWRETSPGQYAFAALTLLLARPIALMLSLWRAQLGRSEKLAAMWFGRKASPRSFTG